MCSECARLGDTCPACQKRIEQTAETVDLVAALRNSIEAAKQRRAAIGSGHDHERTETR